MILTNMTIDNRQELTKMKDSKKTIKYLNVILIEPTEETYADYALMLEARDLLATLE